jgi:hypothetical protein
MTHHRLIHAKTDKNSTPLPFKTPTIAFISRYDSFNPSMNREGRTWKRVEKVTI